MGRLRWENRHETKHWNRIVHGWKYGLIMRVDGVDARLVDVG